MILFDCCLRNYKLFSQEKTFHQTKIEFYQKFNLFCKLLSHTLVELLLFDYFLKIVEQVFQIHQKNQWKLHFLAPNFDLQKGMVNVEAVEVLKDRYPQQDEMLKREMLFAIAESDGKSNRDMEMKLSMLFDQDFSYSMKNIDFLQQNIEEGKTVG